MKIVKSGNSSCWSTSTQSFTDIEITFAKIESEGDKSPASFNPLVADVH